VRIVIDVFLIFDHVSRFLSCASVKRTNHFRSHTLFAAATATRFLNSDCGHFTSSSLGHVTDNDVSFATIKTILSFVHTSVKQAGPVVDSLVFLKC